MVPDSPPDNLGDSRPDNPPGSHLPANKPVRADRADRADRVDAANKAGQVDRMDMAEAVATHRAGVIPR